MFSRGAGLLFWVACHVLLVGVARGAVTTTPSPLDVACPAEDWKAIKISSAFGKVQF